MRNLVRLFAVSMVGIITFGSIVSAAKAPLPTLEPLSVAVRASEGVSEPAIVFRHGDISWLPELRRMPYPYRRVCGGQRLQLHPHGNHVASIRYWTSTGQWNQLGH